MTSWNRTAYDGPNRRLPPQRHADVAFLIRVGSRALTPRGWRTMRVFSARVAIGP